MSFASIGVLVACMVLIGFAILLTQNVNASMTSLEQQNVVMVYFNDENSVIYQNASQISTTSESTESTQSGSEYTSSEDSSSSTYSSSSNTSSGTSSDETTSESTPQIPESAYLIHNEDGQFYTFGQIDATFKKILNRAELKKCGIHSLRHSTAVALLEAKIPLETISDILGHSDISITYRVYAKVIEELKAEAMNIINHVI